MSKRIVIGIALVSLVFAMIGSIQAREVKDYSKTIEEFKKIPVVAKFFDSAYGYAVFPTVGKGGLGVGASHGRGQVYKQGEVIGFTSTSDVSIGLQAGGEAYSQIIFFENSDALIRFTGGNFQFGASAEAIAVQAKADARASTEGSNASASVSKTAEKAVASANYQDGMAIFTMSKGGLMAAAAVAGQKYTYKPVGEGKKQ